MASPPTRQGVRIAYFITSYQSVEQLLRLMKILRRAQPGAPIVIHLDVFHTPFDSSFFAVMPDIHVMTSDSPIIWGDIDLKTVRWRVFRWTLENLDFDWLIMVTEQDYPVAPLRNLENRLATSDADAIVGGVAIEEIKDKRLRREMNARKLVTNLPCSFLHPYQVDRAITSTDLERTKGSRTLRSQVFTPSRLRLPQLHSVGVAPAPVPFESTSMFDVMR
jgi:hypothetical protein